MHLPAPVDPTLPPPTHPTLPPPTHPETVFTYGAPALKFGAGSSDEIGFDLAQYDVQRVLVVTDPGVAATGHPQRVADQMKQFGIEAEVFDRAHVEPTDQSLREAIDFARDTGPWDAYVAVGGGSAIDTAKAVNLLTSNPGELMDYVNVPVGGGAAPVNALRPLVAVPTTTGTGSESTTICVLDVLSMKVKTGISHPRLRPTLAVVDPRLTVTQPAGVTAASGMDILCHALESYTARPFSSYERKQPSERVPYCGSNPIADMWSERSMSLLAQAFRRAVRDGDDEQARGDMSMAATFAGMGFGNAGVHVPHANAYPIAGRVKDFHPRDYPADEPMVPHGMAVSLTAPEAFRFTFDACPERHVRAAEILASTAGTLGSPIEPVETKNPRDLLPAVLVDLMRDIGIPNGIAAVGYAEEDVADLVDGAMKQQRLLATAPREVTEDDLAAIFAASLELW
ncbi:MAG: hydroxyacid-oxoacid transhydrogenase [Nocardioidaceae bacterium]